MEAIGIYDRSICWGVWEPRNPNLFGMGGFWLIAHHPPATWPQSFRLQVRLQEHRYSLAILAECLRQSKISILAAEGAPSGKDHAVINLLCHATELEGVMQDAITAAIEAQKSGGETEDVLDGYLRTYIISIYALLERTVRRLHAVDAWARQCGFPKETTTAGDVRGFVAERFGEAQIGRAHV